MIKTLLHTFALIISLYTANAQAMWDRNNLPRYMGDVFSYALPFAAFSTTVIIGDGNGMKQVGYTIGGTLIATEVLKRGFNYTSLGKRPNGGDQSFPSGHTSAACAGAAFIGQRYGWKYGTAAMIPAAYVGWSRVHANVHHGYDVLAGCAVGIASALLFTSPDDYHTIQPWYENKILGISITSRW